MTSAVGTAPVKSAPKGLGGWLILPIIGFVGTLALTIFNLVNALQDSEALAQIFSANSGALAALQLPIALSIVSGIAVIVSAGACLVFIFQKKSLIVQTATAHYLILAAASSIELWADARLREILPDQPADPSVLKDVGRTVMAALIWIPYFHFSKRVKNTFVSPYDGPNTAALHMKPTPSDASL